MTKTKGVSQRQIRLIKYYSHKGYSANQIQRKLRARHIGMRRTRFLGYVREFKRQTPKAHVERYTPRKYRVVVQLRLPKTICLREDGKAKRKK